MGGTFNTISGRTKLATWLAFKRELRQSQHEDGKTYGPGLYLTYPKNKKDAFKIMTWDEMEKQWVLEYHLHS